MKSRTLVYEHLVNLEILYIVSYVERRADCLYALHPFR